MLPDCAACAQHNLGLTIIQTPLHACVCACSALRDSRFSPVQLKEVSQLSCSVSLLRCFEEAASWQDWEIGQHGLIIEFTDPVLSCKRTATFLPEVAGDQGWSKQQCIEALIRKAGESCMQPSHDAGFRVSPAAQMGSTGSSTARTAAGLKSKGDACNAVLYAPHVCLQCRHRPPPACCCAAPFFSAVLRCNIPPPAAAVLQASRASPARSCCRPSCGSTSCLLLCHTFSAALPAFLSCRLSRQAQPGAVGQFACDALPEQPAVLRLTSNCCACCPAGYQGKPSQELLDSLHVTRYQSSKAALSFADYQAGSCSRLQEDVEQLLQGSSSSSSRGRLGKLLFA